MGRALAFLHGPGTGLIYQKIFFSEHIKFQYPLTSLLLLDMLNWLGVTTARQLNEINGIVLIITGIVFAVFSAKILGPIHVAGIRLPVGPLAFVLALRYFPDHLAFLYGQIQTLLDLVFLVACLAILYERRLLAGCLIGAASMTKPQFVPLGLLAIWHRNWRFVIGFVAVTSICALLSVALYGWRNNLDYLQVLTFLAHHGEETHANQSVNGVLLRFVYHGPELDKDVTGKIIGSMFPPYFASVYYATLLSSIVLMAIPFLMPFKATDVLSRLLQFCTASILFTMASPIAWNHHYGILLPVYVVAFKSIWERISTRNAWVSLVLLGVSFILTGFALTNPLAPTVPAMNILQSHMFIGVCIFVGVLLAEQRARAFALARTVNPFMQSRAGFASAHESGS